MAAVGVVRGDELYEGLAKRDGGSVIAVEVESTSDADVRIDVVSDDVLVLLDDRSPESCEVPVLDVRSRNGSFWSGNIRERSLLGWDGLAWLRSLDFGVGFRDRSG